MSIYRELDYKKIIKNRVRERRKAGLKVTYQAIAEACRIPKSYLSKVLTGGADLSQDQLFLICRELGFSAKEREYISILLEKERSGTSERIKELTSGIKKIQQDQLETKEHLKAQISSGETGLSSAYYLDPFMQIVHAGLTIKKYRSDLKLFAQDLGLQPARLYEIISQLERLGIISVSGSEIKVNEAAMHLPKDSPVYNPWRNLMRLASLKRLDSAPPERSYSFSVTISCDENTRMELQHRFLEFLKGAQETVAAAKEEGIYQMNFDLFPWV